MRASAVILPDRNILTALVGRFSGGQPIGPGQDFLDLFVKAKVLINPLLAALEGNARAIPTPDMARRQVEEAVEKIRAALPEAILMVGPGSVMGVLGLIEDMRASITRKQALLLDAAALLCSPVAQRLVDDRWKRLLEMVDQHQVERASMVTLALLSTLVHPTGPCAARGVLKFRQGYGAGDAYNAVCDLNALELLVHFLAFFPNDAPQICTADRYLSLFWVGIDACDIQRFGDGVGFSLRPHPAILPEIRRWADDILKQSQAHTIIDHLDRCTNGFRSLEWNPMKRIFRGPATRACRFRRMTT